MATPIGTEINLPAEITLGGGQIAQDGTLTSGAAQTQIVNADGTHPDLSGADAARTLRLILAELRAIRILQAKAIGEFAPDLTGADVPSM